MLCYVCVCVSICNGLIIVDPFFSERYSTLAATLRSLKHALPMKIMTNNVGYRLVQGGPPPSLTIFGYRTVWKKTLYRVRNSVELKKMIDFNLLSIYFQLISIYFQFISIYFELISIWFQLISIYFQLISIYFELISIDFNLLSIDFNLLWTDFKLLWIDFNLLWIDFNLF